MEEIYIHNGNEFSRAQVEDAAFEKGITVEEYLAKYGVTLKDQVPEPEPEPELEPQKKPTLDLEAVGKKGGVAGQTVADVTPEVSATDTDLLSEDTLSESQKFVTADLFSENEEEVAKELNGLLATYGGYIKESGVFQNGIEVLIGEEPTFEGKFVHGEEQYLPRSGKLMTGKKTTPEQREENARILNSFLATYGDKGYLDSALADGETMEMVNDFKNKATVPASGLTNEQIMFDVFEKFEHYVDRENSIIELEQKERVGFMTDEQLTNELEAAKKAVSKQLVFKDEKEEERYKKFKEGGVIPDFTEEEYEEMRHEKKWKKYDEVARDYSYDLSQEERNKMHAVLWSEKNEVDKTRKKFETDVDEHVKKTDTLEKRIQDYKDNPTSYELYKEVKELQLAFIEESNRLQEQQIILQRELKETEFLPIAIKDFGSNYRRLQQLGTSFKSLGTDIAYSILQIGQLTGFGQPAAAVHAVSKWSLTPEQRNKALDESTGIITMRERMNVETESYQRSIGVDEIKTLSDLGRWTASSTTNLIPSLAMAFTGPAALPLFALSGWGSAGTDVAIKQKNAAERMIVNKKELVENPDMDMIRKVELENQMDEDSKILKISNWEQLSLQALYGVSEVVFERLGTMSLIKGARAAIRSLPPATVKEGFEFAGKQLFKGITVEGGSEFGTTIAQNFGDIYILGEDKNIFEDSLESFAQGALMGAGITSVAGGRAIKHTISSELATRAEDRRMREIVIQLRELTGITSLQNIPDGNIKMPNQSPEVQTLIAELTQEKENITNDIIAKLDNGDISIQQAYEIGGINRELRKIGERYNALMHDKNLSPQQLEAAEKELGQQYEALKEKRENILTDPSILKENQDLAINDNIRKDWEMGNSMYSMRMSNNTALNLLDQWGGLNNSVKQGYYEEAKKALRKGAEKYKRFSEKEIQDKAVELYIEKSYRRKIEEGERNARTYATTRGEDLNIYKGETIEETIGLMKTHGVMESIAESLKKQILEEGGKPPSMEELLRIAETKARADIKNGIYEASNTGDNIIVHMPNAIKNGRTGIFAHEVLHSIAKKKYGSEAGLKQAGMDLLDYLEENDKDLYTLVKHRIDQSYVKRDPKTREVMKDEKGKTLKEDAYWEEAMNAMSDIIADGQAIKTSSLNTIRRFVNKLLPDNFKFKETDQEAVFNFIKDFNKEAHFGKKPIKFEDVLGIAKPEDEGKTTTLKDEDEEAPSTKFSKTINESYNTLTAEQLKTIKSLKSKDALKELADKDNTLTAKLKELAQEGKGKTKEFTDLNSQLNKIKDTKDAWFSVQESIRPLVTGLVNNKYFKAFKTMDKKEAEEKKRDIIENTLTNQVLNLVQKYDPSKIKGGESTLHGYLMQKLNRFDATGKRMSLIEVKVIGEANKVGLDISKDVDETKQTIEQPEIEKGKESVKKKLFTKKLDFDKEAIEGEFKVDKDGKKVPKTFADIFIDAVAKTFGTKLPAVTNKNFVKVFSKNNIAELMPFVRSFTKIDRKKGIDKFKPFVIKHFKAILDQLPASVINKKYDMLRKPVLKESGQQKREETKEGKGEFEYLNIDRKDFVDYFTNPNPNVIATVAGKITIKDKNGDVKTYRIVKPKKGETLGENEIDGTRYIGKRIGDTVIVKGEEVQLTNIEIASNTLSDRRTSLLETLINELSADAALEVVKDKTIMQKFRDIQEIEGQAVPDNFLDVIVEKLDRGIDYLNNLQKNNGELYARLGLPEIIVQAIKVFMQTLSTTLKATNNFGKALKAGIKAAQNLFETKDEKDIIKKVLEETFTSAKSITKEKIESAVEKSDRVLFTNAGQKIIDSEITRIKGLKGRTKLQATKDFIKHILPSYINNEHLKKITGSSNEQAFNYLNKPLGLKENGFDVEKVGNKTSIVHYAKDGTKTSFRPLADTRPSTINGKYLAKKYKTVDDFLSNLNDNRYDIDKQSKDSANAVVREVSRIAATGDIQGAKDLLMILGEYSDSILRLAGKLRDIETNLEVKRNKDGTLKRDKKNKNKVISGITYEHTLTIKNLRTQIEALLDVYEKDGNLNKLEKNMEGVLNRSYVDLIDKKWKSKMDTTETPKDLQPSDDSRVRLKKAGIKTTPIFSETKFSKTNNSTELNEMIERTKGIPAKERISIAKAKIEGFKSDKFQLFMRNSAEDLLGLLYQFAGKKEQGNADLKWIKETFTRPLTRANLEFEAHQIKSHKTLQEAKVLMGEQKIDLTAEVIDGYTVEQAIRVHLWTKRGYVVPGMDEFTGTKKRTKPGPEQEKVNKWVRQNFDSLEFTDAIEEAYFRDDKKYPEPNEDWVSGTLTTDLLEHTNEVTRAEIFQPFFDNVNVVFGKFDKYHGKLSGVNVNKVRGIYGNSFVEALESSFYRIGTGRNRSFQLDEQGTGILDWVNNAIGNTMFIHTRSALLQTISSVNFINLGDNNPIAAAKAFKNQPKFWGYFNKIFFSDYLKQRRAGLRTDVNEQEIASAASNSKNPTRAVIATILKRGFWPTQMADSFAIAFGGSSFLSNREAKYKKDGLSDQDAFDQAFEDMREIAEDTQQSGRPEKISQEQAGFGGRLILAFQNTPMQYNRQIKKAFLDLKNGRGDWKTNVMKISNYLIIQNVIFHSMQQALFAILFDEPENDKEEKREKTRKIRVMNGMADSVLRGTGVFGALLATVKNTIMKIVEREGFDEKAIEEIFNMSPPIGRKTRQLFDMKDRFTYKQNLKKMKEMGLDTENPAVLAAADALSFGINLPADRVLRKINNIKAASDKENEMWQRMALSLGWSKWEVNIPFEDAKDTDYVQKPKKNKPRANKPRKN